jgi:RND family efflux transporter MFP subunit
MIRSAQAAVRGAQVALENTRIRAPFDGTVLTKNADVGEVVAPLAATANARAAVVTMADMSSLQVEADVSESNIIRVTIGQLCEIVLDAYPEKRYPGAVHKIVPTADRAKATVLTKVAFRERDERVLPEMSAKVTFLSKDAARDIAGAAPKLTVPASAVMARDGSWLVLRVRDGLLEHAAVTIGERMAGRVEIVSGLSPGDMVLKNPAESLRPGMSVKIK